MACTKLGQSFTNRSMDPTNPYDPPKDEPKEQDLKTEGAWVSTSLLELYLLSFLVTSAFALRDEDMLDSPRIAELFGWAFAPLQRPLFLVTTISILSIPFAAMGMVWQPLLNTLFPNKFPVTIWRRGRPMVVGAIIRVLTVIAFFAAVCAMAKLED